MNKNKKRLIIVAISTLLLLVSIISVFAAYTYNKKVSVDSEVGIIPVKSQCFYDYSKGTTLTSSDDNYGKALKMRTDTVVVVDNVEYNTSITYSVITGSGKYFEAGEVYYIKNDQNQYEIDSTVIIGDEIPSGTYYKKVTTYNSIKSFEIYDSGCAEVGATPNGNTITFTIGGVSMSAACTISSDGLITDVNLTINQNPLTLDYRVVVNSNGLGFVVLDNAKTKTTFTTINENKVIVSATESKYLEGTQTDANKKYLSQLGLHFEFTSDVPVYVKVNVRQQWDRFRVIGSTIKPAIITNEFINGKSPFLPSDDNWFMKQRIDSDEKRLSSDFYLKTMFVPEDSSDVQSYTFNVYEAYYYMSQITGVYSEFVDVEVEFSVDIVQANRVKAKWGVDPSTFIS